jgi:hypothetical protein
VGGCCSLPLLLLTPAVFRSLAAGVTDFHLHDKYSCRVGQEGKGVGCSPGISPLFSLYHANSLFVIYGAGPGRVRAYTLSTAGYSVMSGKYAPDRSGFVDDGNRDPYGLKEWVLTW